MRFALPATCLAFVCALPVHAAGTQPIWATTPSATMDGAAMEKFQRAVQRRGLPAPLTVDIPAPPAPPAPPAYRSALTLPLDSPAEAVAAAFGRAADAAIQSGGAGLTRDELPDLFFRQAVALQRAAGPIPSIPTGIEPLAAKTAYLRALSMGLSQTPAGYVGDPLVESSLRLARQWLAGRATATLSVRARPTATVFIDNRPYPHPARATGLPMGEHLVRVEEVGRLPFAAVVPLSEPEVAIDTPAMDILRFPATEAAALAKARRAPFALLAQLRLGDAAEVDLSLVDAETGHVRSSSAVNVASDDETVFAAVLRLDEEANRVRLEKDRRPGGLAALDLALPPPKQPDQPEFKTDPEGWAAKHWPLVTAVGVAVGSAVVLGIVVAVDKDSTAAR